MPNAELTTEKFPVGFDTGGMCLQFIVCGYTSSSTHINVGSVDLFFEENLASGCVVFVWYFFCEMICATFS